MNFGGTIQVNRNILMLLLGAFSLLLIYQYNLPHGTKKAVNLKELLSAAVDAAVRGGRKVFVIREQASLHEKSKGKTAEGANNPVTDGDMESHLEMYHSIKKAFPNVKIISEEKPTHKIDDLSVKAARLKLPEAEWYDLRDAYVDTSDVRVWIDPLDATQEYTENLRQYVTTMVCVAVKGVPVIGVIHAPFNNITYWAWTGFGGSSALNILKDRKVAPAEVKNVRIIVSRSHKGKVDFVARQAFGEGSSITSAGGAGFKTIEVLQQHQDVYVHTTLIKKWDICAGNAMLNHFGGKMTTLNGDTITYGEESEYKNPGGLIATLFNHNFYVDKLKVLNEV